jgi:hemoglobin
MTSQKYDIKTREDISRLITDFYQRVRQDDQLSFHFKDVDWGHHTPIIIDFWAMILLGESNYKGNPLSKHMHMNLKRTDFERWLELFFKTVDHLFEGEKAEEAKHRATSIAGIFQFKMNIP